MGNPKRLSCFISLEGGEGSGKTSQINKLASFLTDQGYNVVTTREPGGTEEAEAIRNVLVQRDGGNWTPMAEVLLLYAARVMHVDNVIRPALENGKIVICDRFSDSTFAYQGYGRGMNLDQINAVHELTLGSFQPDITFLLDIESRAGLERSKKRLAIEQGYEQTEDRFERMELEFHERLREGFLKIVDENSERCRIVDASQPIDDVHANIKSHVIQKLADIEKSS